LCGFTPPHLGQGTFAAQSPITCPKRQLPETLSAIWARLKKNKKHVYYGIEKIFSM